MDVMVSILTTAYNHAPYIAECIENILCQKTDFLFELIIHDDASTDGTTEIIQKYAEMYPDIIHPIFQKENQYSKGVNIYAIMRSLVRGKYVAQCEGDDYWCDENKLQKQVRFLEKYDEYSACVHNSIEINELTGERRDISSACQDYDITFEQVIQGGNAVYQSSSLLYRKTIFSLCLDERPDFFEGLTFGDYPLAIYLCCKGKIRYFAEKMSIYRFLTPSSWTLKYNNLTAAEYEQYMLLVVGMLTKVDIYTKRKYKIEIENVIEKKYLSILLYYLRKSELNRQIHDKYFEKLHWKNRLTYIYKIGGKVKKSLKKLR